MNKPQTYYGAFPSRFPKRGYYKVGDGYEHYISWANQIKLIQQFLNWALAENLAVDGKYGPKTNKACLKFQQMAGMVGTHGNWGPKSQELAKKFKV